MQLVVAVDNPGAVHTMQAFSGVRFEADVLGKDEGVTLSRHINLQADATEGLHCMHGAGIVHCDHKLHNVLICRSGGPMGFVAKVTDPGVW